MQPYDQEAERIAASELEFDMAMREVSLRASWDISPDSVFAFAYDLYIIRHLPEVLA